jgi:cytochrome oxidase Cu insertion factor (SCO1/SenC/PrrC family)
LAAAIITIVVQNLDIRLAFCYSKIINSTNGAGKALFCCKERKTMPKVSINAPAPDFTLEDYRGDLITLSDFKGKQNVLLVFNRGFQ